MVVFSVRTSPRDGRRGVDRQRAAGHEHGLDRGALEDGRAVEDDDRLDLAGDGRRPAGDEHDVGLLAGRHGDVAVEGHENPVATSDRRVCCERGRGGQTNRSTAATAAMIDKRLIWTSRDAGTWFEMSTVTGRIRDVIGHPALKARAVRTVYHRSTTEHRLRGAPRALRVWQAPQTRGT